MTIIITSVFRSLFLSVILVAPISTTGHTLRGPLPPSGLSFTRTISDIPGSFDLQFDGNHCQLQDDYGDNECHFDWGEDITGRYKVQIDEDIVEGDVLEGHFKIDRIVPYSFTCALCGEDCILTFPVVKFNYTIPIPACPVAPHETHKNIEYQLMGSSPTDGIPTHIEGTVKITKNTGRKIAEFSVSATVK